MEIHERIKARRRECDLSVDEVASALGVSRATVYRYESSEIKNMGVDKLESLAAVLKTTPEYLMGWTDEPINYDADDYVAEIPSYVLKKFNGDVKKALAFMKAQDEDAAAEAAASRKYYLNSEIADMVDQLHKNPEMRILFDASKKLTKDDLQFIIDMIKRMKRDGEE